MFKIRITQNPLGPEILAALDADEAAGALAVSERDDTLSLTVLGAGGAPMGYCVFGRDAGDMIAIYYTRALVPGLGAAMMKQLFGVAQVLGTPLRVHVDSVRGIATRARMFGAKVATEGVDADGIMQGIFR